MTQILKYYNFRFFLLTLIVSITGCQSIMRPDLARLYHSSMASSEQPPVILIHGILGARLRDKQSLDEKWPGSIWNILFNDYRDVALPIDPISLEPQISPLEAFDITDSAAGQDFYGAIIRTLANAGGYSLGQISQPAPPNARRYYVFFYDWREDNVKSAQKLDSFIEQIRSDYNNPELKVDIVAHSMGGLLARYYIRYGTQDVLNENDFPVSGAGGKKVRRAILLGTPNFGSLSALQSLTLGHQIGLNRIPVEVLATMPSIYQLLPHALNSWILTHDGRELKRDIFDVEIWKAFQWSIFDPHVEARVIAQSESSEAGREKLQTLQIFFAKSLERARRFTWSLSVPEPNPSVSYITFGGDCLLTPTRVIVEEHGGDSVVRYFPEEVRSRVDGINYEDLMLEPGDGLVTKASLLARNVLDPRVARHKYSFFPVRSSFFLCEKHDQLTGNINFQDNLLQALLSIDDS